MEMTVLGNFLGGTIGKVTAVIALVALVGAGFYVMNLRHAVASQEAAILRQQGTIQAQASTIETLTLQSKLQEAANSILEERLNTRAIEIELLTSEIESILIQGEDNDGPVAPVLDSVVRAPGSSAR
jgi:uncharacterized protein HemX